MNTASGGINLACLGRLALHPSLAPLLLVAAAACAYLNGLTVPWLFDDERAITGNPTIRHLFSPAALHPPADGSGVAGRPLVNLTLAVNHAIGGDAVRGYHVFNLALHCGTALLVFGLARLTLGQPTVAAWLRPAARPLALAIAALWALHPLQTESVTCVIQRTELLVGFFYAATLYSLARAALAPGVPRWPVVCVTSCLLGMAGKEVMVTAPVIAWLFDRTFFAGTFAAAWRSRGRLHLALGATWLLLALLVAAHGGTRGPAAGFGLGVSSWSYALTQCDALLLYVRLALWPHPLVLDYGTDLVTDAAAVAPAIVLCVAAGLATVVAVWRWPAAGFLGACFFVILAPSSSVVPLVTQTVAEHRMYLPLAAVVALAATGAFRLCGSRLWAPLVLAAGLFAGLTALRNRTYQDEHAIWADTVARRPGNARAHMGLGLALFRAGHHEQSLARLAQAVTLRPAYAEAHNNLGLALARTGRTAEAIAAYEAALRALPGYPDAAYNLAVALLQLGRAPEAIARLRDVVQARPDFAAARNNLGIALASTNRLPEAVAEFEALLTLDPANAEAHNNLGTCWRNLGRPAAARRHYQEAVRLRPGFTLARENLARLVAPAAPPP
ncbi:MAG: tetratricopeptide repeat protein [Verrucomicrobia bacterium]|nr:tetratricopeptide repeat protein [Verrucomicrobiota bacterium]